MKALRFSAVCIFVYLTALLIQAIVYAPLLESSVPLVRSVMRVVGMSYLTYLLFQQKKWAWWILLSLVGLFSVAGCFSLGAAVYLYVSTGEDMLAAGAYPLLDKIALPISCLCLVSAFVAMLTPSARRHVSGAADETVALNK